uniref:Phosphatidylinositol-glycan biosynthesis class W protein n=1 Tax=Bracon brevicornis TaxID=1563983 RepID=A0A6V7MAH6_9HYME
MESIDDQEQYRKAQEEFVSNHGGSSAIEILLVMVPSILAISLTHLCFMKWGGNLSKNLKPVVEIILNVIPCVLCCTILSEYTGVIIMMMILLCYILLSSMKCSGNEIRAEKSPNKISFLTNFRALTNIITAICILAVDFKMFPRKFAKTEVYGLSLMDTGVGLFIMANALVSPEARHLSEGPKTNLWSRFTQNAQMCTKATAPLLILGFGRFIAIEYSGYQKHVTEYGIHWNFFITLAFIKIFTSTIATAISSKYAGLTGLWIIGMHEYALSANGIKEWVLGNSPRDDFVSANREGLISVPGYVGLYLIGIALGRVIHMAHNSSKRHISASIKKYNIRKFEFEYNKFSIILITKLLVIIFITSAITFSCNVYFGISRRLANAGYCAWILLLTSIVLDGLLLVDTFLDAIIQIVNKNNGSRKKTNNRNGSRRVTFEDIKTNRAITIDSTPEIFQAVNYNGLIFFLIANLMTGLINMTIRTIYVESFYALQVVTYYIIIVVMVALILYRYRIQLKL